MTLTWLTRGADSRLSLYDAHSCFLELNELFATTCEVPCNLPASHLTSLSPFSLTHPSGLQPVPQVCQALSSAPVAPSARTPLPTFALLHLLF